MNRPASPSILLLDDSPLVARAVEAWLTENSTTIPALSGSQVYPVETVAGLEAELSDPDMVVDLVVVDPVLHPGQPGGLKGIALTARLRPEIPIVMYSAMENNGDRFMYVLAAATWFAGSRLSALIPKVFHVGETAVGFRVSEAIAQVIAGTHVDPLLTQLRAPDIRDQFARLLHPSDLASWRAVMRQPKQSDAAALVGKRATTFRDWEREKLDALSYLWERLNVTPVGGQPGMYDNDAQAGSTHLLLRQFAYQQSAFFADPFLDEWAGSESVAAP